MAGPATSSSGWIRRSGKLRAGNTTLRLLSGRPRQQLGVASPRQWKRGATHLLNTLIRRVILATLPAVLMTASGPSLDQQYQQLNAQLSGEIASQQVHIERLQGAVKVIVNSELLFPSGGWQMPPTAAATIAKMAPILASQVQEHIYVNGYTDNTPMGQNSPGRA